MSHGFQVTFDCAEPQKLAEFWGDVLGYVLQPPPPGFESWDAFADSIDMPEDERDGISAVVDPDGRGPRLLFLRVPEHKAAKNRVHLDVNVGADLPPGDERRAQVRAEGKRVVAAGATMVAEFDGPTGHWIVLHDPEGNEFCLQ